MKGNYFLMLLILLGACGGAKRVDDNTTPEKLAETILSAVIRNDTTLLSKYTIQDREEIKVFFIKFWEQDKLTEGRLRAADRITNDRPNVIKSLEQVRNEFRQGGMPDWSDVKLELINYSESEKSPSLINGVKINFSNGKFIGVIRIDRFAELERGWVLLDPLTFDYYGPNLFGQ